MIIVAGALLAKVTTAYAHIFFLVGFQLAAFDKLINKEEYWYKFILFSVFQVTFTNFSSSRHMIRFWMHFSYCFGKL
jgi:hypothetical protein